MVEFLSRLYASGYRCVQQHARTSGTGAIALPRRYPRTLARVDDAGGSSGRRRAIHLVSATSRAIVVGIPPSAEHHVGALRGPTEGRRGAGFGESHSFLTSG